MTIVRLSPPLLALALLTASTVLGLVHSTSVALLFSSIAEEYELDQEVTLNGSLTVDDVPQTGQLVAVQINKPDQALWVIRTRPTGDNLTEYWPMEIVEASLFKGTTAAKGSTIGFNLTIKNNDLISRQATVFVNTFYSNNVPFAVAQIGYFNFEANRTISVYSSSVLTVPTEAPVGSATAYFSVLTDLPVNGGFAYCPEKALVFQIMGDDEGATSRLEALGSTDGMFVLEIQTPDSHVKLGNYTAFATVFFPPYRLQSNCTFKVVLRGDISGPSGLPDGICDIRDIARVAKSFGAYPGHPLWDPIADLNEDSKIDIKDVALVAKDYGKVGEL